MFGKKIMHLHIPQKNCFSNFIIAKANGVKPLVALKKALVVVEYQGKFQWLCVHHFDGKIKAL